MLSAIINYLGANISRYPYIESMLGLGRVVFVPVEGGSPQKFPVAMPKGQPENINFDTTKTTVFFLQDGPVQRETNESEYIACQEVVKETYRLKCIIYSQGKEDMNANDSMSQRVAWAISKALTGKHQGLMDATGIDFALMKTVSTDLDKVAIWNELHSAPCQLKDDDYLAKINISVEIEGSESCFVPYPCEEIPVLAGEDGAIIQTSGNEFIWAGDGYSGNQFNQPCVGETPFAFNGDGGTTYVIPGAAGRPLHTLTTDGVHRNFLTTASPQDCIYNKTSGTLVFSSAISTETIIAGTIGAFKD